MTKNTLLLLVCAVLLTACMDLPDRKKTTTLSETYRKLSVETNGKADSLIKNIASLEEVEKLSAPILLVKYNPDSYSDVEEENEFKRLKALFEISLEEIDSLDASDMTEVNTFFIRSSDEITKETFALDSIPAKEGYYVDFPVHSIEFDQLSMLWKQAHTNYKPLSSNDSIYDDQRMMIEKSYEDSMSLLDQIKYVVILDDVMLIPPIIDYYNDAYLNGCIGTNVYVFDFKTQQKLLQKTILSQNEGRVEYESNNESLSADQDIILKKLHEQLLNEREKKIDSMFDLQSVDDVLAAKKEALEENAE